MKEKRIMLKLLSIVCLLSLLAACAPAATQAPAPDVEEPAATEPAATEPAATEAAATEPAAAEPVTLTWLIDDSQQSQEGHKALADAYMALHPNVTIEFENRPQGGDGDNIVKTRLATGEMTDLFSYNSGSLLQALHPTDTLVDLTNDPYIANIVESFLPTVSQNGQIFGVPNGTAMGGGILYNKKVYEDLGLSVPKTWAEFEANNEAIKAAGIAPVIASYGPNSTWTSQLFVLADYCNVQNAMPSFAEDYTANKIKMAETPAALAGFNYLAEGNEQGWYQENFTTTTFDQALQLLAEGQGAHYPMLSFALAPIATNWPDAVQDIGYFGQPGTDASQHCTTLWMPGGTYIPQTSENIDAAKDVLAFIASVEGTDAMTAKVPPQGPYMIKGSTLPADALPAVLDIQSYIEAGTSIPALEFLSPIKGPALEQITVAVGSGQMTPEEGAANYDEDVKKQAQQLGLPEWIE
jgi:raffinose/stachyose/melibiose transport system substrate-binding protein